MSVHVGAMRIDLHIPGASSLKGRRAVLNRAKASLRNDLKVSVAEVDNRDIWQRASLAVAVVAGDPSGVEHVLERVVAVVERDPAVVVTGVVTDREALDLDGDPTLGLLTAHGFGLEDDEGCNPATDALVTDESED